MSKAARIRAERKLRQFTNAAFRAALISKGINVGKSRTVNTYFIQGETTRLIKIGRCIGDAARRMRELQACSPDRLILRAVVAGDIERKLHARFTEDHEHGEWFRPSAAIEDFIKSLSTTVYG